MRKGSCVACLVGALRTTDFRVHSSRHQLQLWYSYSTFQGSHVRLPRYETVVDLTLAVNKTQKRGRPITMLLGRISKMMKLYMLNLTKVS